MSATNQTAVPDEIREQASAWLVRLHSEPSAADLDRLEQWRALSESHQQAFDEALAAWMIVGEHATAPRMLAMRRDALERAHRASRWWNRRTVAAVVAAVAVVPLAAVAWFKLHAPQPQDFQTAQGEQRVIVLADGSRMSMDARTQVQVTYTDDVRGIEVVAGRANFEVTKDVTRPFKVKAGPHTVTALGTVFTVERAPRQVLVTLLEGRVAVGNRDNVSPPVEMHALQELRVTDAGKVSMREGIDPVQALAWREGKLIFDDERLEDVATRINNYGATQVIVAGEARNLRVSGVFKAGDTGAFVDAMKSYFSLQAEQRPAAVILRPGVPAARTD